MHIRLFTALYASAITSSVDALKINALPAQKAQVAQDAHEILSQTRDEQLKESWKQVFDSALLAQSSYSSHEEDADDSASNLAQSGQDMTAMASLMPGGDTGVQGKGFMGAMMALAGMFTHVILPMISGEDKEKLEGAMKLFKDKAGMFDKDLAESMGKFPAKFEKKQQESQEDTRKELVDAIMDQVEPIAQANGTNAGNQAAAMQKQQMMGAAMQQQQTPVVMAPSGAVVAQNMAMQTSVGQPMYMAPAQGSLMQTVAQQPYYMQQQPATGYAQYTQTTAAYPQQYYAMQSQTKSEELDEQDQIESLAQLLSQNQDIAF